MLRISEETDLKEVFKNCHNGQWPPFSIYKRLGNEVDDWGVHKNLEKIEGVSFDTWEEAEAYIEEHDLDKDKCEIGGWWK